MKLRPCGREDLFTLKEIGILIFKNVTAQLKTVVKVTLSNIKIPLIICLKIICKINSWSESLKKSSLLSVSTKLKLSAYDIYTVST